MNRLYRWVWVACVALGGCVSVPQPGSSTPAPTCPFSQATSGTCVPASDKEFCPPGDARAGLCKPR